MARGPKPVTPVTDQHKILRASERYGLEDMEPWVTFAPRLFCDVYMGNYKSYAEFLPRAVIADFRQQVFEADKDFSLVNPIMLHDDGRVRSAGQRIFYAWNHGYHGIDCVLTDDRNLQRHIFDCQRAYAKTYFPYDRQEHCEQVAPSLELARERLAAYVEKRLNKTPDLAPRRRSRVHRGSIQPTYPTP